MRIFALRVPLTLPSPPKWGGEGKEYINAPRGKSLSPWRRRRGKIIERAMAILGFPPPAGGGLGRGALFPKAARMNRWMETVDCRAPAVLAMTGIRGWPVAGASLL
jgi:hypothetical protein